jgi:hypothetical protein
MNRNAYTGGLALLHQWNDKEFYVDAKMVGSTITGSPDAIDVLQRSSARYYQRPDIRDAHLDSVRTTLSGYGGRIKVGKGSKGFWRYAATLSWRSPGLDLNDIGYMQTADIIKLGSAVSYFVNQPVSIFRTYSFSVNETSNWDFGGRYLSSLVSSNVYLEFLSQWALSTTLSYTTQSLDPWLLRGGYAMKLPESWTLNVYGHTDASEKVYGECTFIYTTRKPNGNYTTTLQPAVSVMPSNTLKLSASLNYILNADDLQYVDTKSVNQENRYILARIRQQSLGATFRIDYNLTPELSLQYYGSPFASVGRYSVFKTVTNPKAASYADRFSILHPVLQGDTLAIPDPSGAFTFGSPDFSFGQFRSILVFRWEYMPGSQLYVVWSHERTRYIQPDAQSVESVLGNIGTIAPNNIVLVKLNYWFSI